MTFDGRIYLSPALVRAIHYHSEAGATAEVLSRALISSYVAARLNERQVFECTYPFDHRKPTRSRDWPNGWSSTSYVPIGDGYRWLPAEATHLVCEALYSVFGDQATVTHRLSIAGGVATGAELALQTAPGNTPRIGSRGSVATRQRAERLSPYGPSPSTYRARFEVAIPPAALGAEHLVVAEAKLSVATASYVPQSVVAWWECRE